MRASRRSDCGRQGISPDGELIEIMEYAPASFMVGTQFHPEFLSRPDRPHPLFREFVGVASNVVREGGQRRLPTPFWVR